MMSGTASPPRGTCSGCCVSPVCPKIPFRRLNILHYHFCPLVHFPFNISACSSETELVHSNGIKSHNYPRAFWSDLESLQERRVGLKSGRGSQGLRWLRVLIGFRNNPRWLTALKRQSYPYVTVEELLVIEKNLTCYCSQFSATLSNPTHADLALHHRPYCSEKPYCDLNDMSWLSVRTFHVLFSSTIVWLSANQNESFPLSIQSDWRPCSSPDFSF